MTQIVTVAPPPYRSETPQLEHLLQCSISLRNEIFGVFSKNQSPYKVDISSAKFDKIDFRNKIKIKQIIMHCTLR